MKKTQKNINGILLLDKPLNITSNGALQRVKHLFNAKKAGHTGSLDPLATGMLPICFGEATKFSQFLLESDKHYEVIAKLGVKTTTGDAEGSPLSERPLIDITESRVLHLLKDFEGAIQQIPPMYSAVKHQGKALYTLARQGIEVPREPRMVHIYSLQFLGLTNDLLHLTIHCSKGTYVRTLVEDLGEQLGCGAHVHYLKRSFVAPYREHAMHDFTKLESVRLEAGIDALQQFLLPVETSVEGLPLITLSTSLTFYIRMGQPIMVPGLPSAGLVRLLSDKGHFLGVGEVQTDGRLAPRRLVQN